MINKPKAEQANFWSREYKLPPTLFGQIRELLNERSFQPLWITLAVFAFVLGGTVGVVLAV
jgi:hypothetical protein